MITIAIVDDKPYYREGMRAWFAQYEPELDVLQEVSDVESLPTREPTDVVVLDVKLENGTTLEHNLVQARAHGRAVVVVTMEEQPTPAMLHIAFTGGALAFVSKDSYRDIAEAVRHIATEETTFPNPLFVRYVTEVMPDWPERLTDIQATVLNLMADGLYVSQIARLMNRDRKTIREHIARIREKLKDREGHPLEKPSDFARERRDLGYTGNY